MKIIVAAVLAIAAGCASQTAGPLLNGVEVGPNVMVNAADPSHEHMEMLAAADPQHPNQMMACSIVHSGISNTADAVYVSSDAGASWKRTLFENDKPIVGDPACTYGLDGTAYFASLDGVPPVHGDVNIYRSADGGRTWRVVTRVPYSWRGANIDREYFTVDRSQSKYHGTIYFYWNAANRDIHGVKHGERFELMRLAGGHLTKPISPPAKGYDDRIVHMEGVVTSDGTLVIPYTAIRDMKNAMDKLEIRVARSTDGGRTLSAPVLIANAKSCRDYSPSNDYAMQPAAIDRSSSPFHDRVYVTWSDESTGPCRAMIASSSDSGKTWTPPATIHEGRARANGVRGPDQVQPAITVNSNGVVGMSWYDTRENPRNTSYRLRMALSYDGGASFAPSFAVSTATNDLAHSDPFVMWSHPSGGGSQNAASATGPLDERLGPGDFVWDRGEPGDTRAMLADASGRFYPFWFDNRSGIIGLYTARVTSQNRASRNGDPSLSALRDVTKDIDVQYASTNFDPKSGMFTLNVSLVNRSKNTLKAPLKMRLLWAESPAGDARAANAGNRLDGSGAIWDFSADLPGATLKPGTRSKAAPITFQIQQLDPALIGFPLLSFESRVYSK